MDAAKTLKKDQSLANDSKTDEPQSAHATPVVEKYIKIRNKKAEKQIKHEGHGDSHAE